MEKRILSFRQNGRTFFLPLLIGLALIGSPLLLPDQASARKAPPPPPYAEGGYLGAQEGLGGYTGPGPELSAVTDAQALTDGAWIALKGNIIRSLGGDDYMFADSTGEIAIKIGPREWMGQYIGASDTVEILGRMHKDWSGDHIHVMRLTKQ